MTDPDPELRTGVHSLWEEGLLFDYTIEVDGHEFRAHKALLASISGYFKALLTNGMLESKQDRLKLPGFSSLAVHNMIEYIYQKKFGDTKASYDELFELSTYLQIPSAIKVCTNELCKETNAENCMDMFNLFTLHNITEGTEQVAEYIKSNIDAVLGVHKVDDLPSQVVYHLHDCLGKSEWDLFSSLKDWVNADYDNHKEHVDGLMRKVRFALMTPTELRAVKNQDIYTQCPGAWQNLIDKAIKYHRMPTHKKVLDKSEQTQIRTNSTPVCFPVNVDNNPGFHVLHDETTWEEHEGFLAPAFSAGVVTVVVNNFLIAYDQSSEHKGMYIFDPRTLTWSEIGDVGGLLNNDFALVHHDEHLYALGGRVGTQVVPEIIRYSFNRNEWDIIPTVMPLPVHLHAACVVQDTIFVSGGKHTSGGNDTRKVHCLDLNTTTWTAKARMLHPTSSHQMGTMTLSNKVGMLVLTQDIQVQLYIVATDQWTVINLQQKFQRQLPLKLNNNSTIINGGNCVWMLNVTIEVDPTQVVNPAGGVEPNQRSQHGICFGWAYTDKRAGVMIVPERFPLYVEGANENDALVKKYFTAMLNIPQHTRKARIGPMRCYFDLTKLTQY